MTAISIPDRRAWLLGAAIIGLGLVIVVVGAVLTRCASYDAFPEFAPPRVEVQTEAPGLGSEEVESLVTTPLEITILRIL